MKYLILAFKRAMRTVYVPILLVLCAVIAFFAPLISSTEELPKAAVYSADKSEMAGRVVDYLTDNLYVECESEEALREKISRGEYNCGVVIYDGFEEKVKDGDTEEIVLFLSSPSAFIPMIYKNHVMAAIYREYAPYVTASLIDDEHFADEEVIERYFDMTAEGGRFTFVIQREDNALVEDDDRAFAYTVGLSALIIFALIMYGVRSAVASDLETMRKRIGAGRAIAYSVVPSLVVRAVSVVAAFSAGIVLSAVCIGDNELMGVIGAVAIYTLLVTAFGVLVASVCKNPKVIEIITFFILVGGLVLCPIYYDISIVVPWIGTFRNILPVYWLWLCNYSVILMLVIALIAVPASFALLYITAKKRK